MRKVLLLIFLLIGCQSQIVQKKVDDDLVLRQRAFAEELYLPSVTPWANFSDSTGCQRESDWNYLNIFEVKNKTGLDFFSILNLQYQLNALWFQKRPLMAVTTDKQAVYLEKLKPTDRLTLFEQSLELVNGGVSFWNKAAVNYPIWFIDWDNIKANEKLIFLMSLLPHPDLQKVIPVIVSRCESSYSIKKILEPQPELLSFSFILGAEVMTPYVNADGPEITTLHHPLELYFPVGVSMTWILPESVRAQQKKDKIKIDGKDFKVLYL